MVPIVFTYYAKELSDGRHKINLFIKCKDPTWTDRIGEERHAMDEAISFVRKIVEGNSKHGDDRMLVDGEPDEDMFPVFMFSIGFKWNKKTRIAHVSKEEHKRYIFDAKWNPVACLGMEQYEYTFGALREWERIRIRELETRRARAGLGEKK